MIEKNDITGFLLAGGKSSRMGVDKALVHYKGKKLIEYSIQSLAVVCNELLISANNFAYKQFNIKQIKDNYQNLGPIGGLEACLLESKTIHNLFSPCDTPFIDANFFSLIIQEVENYDAVVPISSDGKMEPLIAYYSKKIHPIVLKQIANGDFKIQNLLKNIRTKFIIMDQTSSFMNINTMDDLNTILNDDSSTK